jgi:hypothetical protein
MAKCELPEYAKFLQLKVPTGAKFLQLKDPVVSATQ